MNHHVMRIKGQNIHKPNNTRAHLHGDAFCAVFELQNHVFVLLCQCLADGAVRERFPAIATVHLERVVGEGGSGVRERGRGGVSSRNSGPPGARKRGEGAK